MDACKICGCKNYTINYKGRIRDGQLGRYTKDEITVYKCSNCGAIWHEPIYDLNEYYQSKEYRLSLENTTEEMDFYRLHDKESLDKFTYTGTSIFRGKTVVDIGCGCGAFLDYIKGVAKEVVAIEPSECYRQIMEKKGFITYPYSEDALKSRKEKCDVIVSFDVIEHVEDPRFFIFQAYDLLCKGGVAIIGTPTEAPIMRELLGEDFEMQLLFSTQHLWILSEKSLRLIAAELKAKSVRIRYFQRYGIQNFIGWVRDRKPKADISSEWMTETMDAVMRKQMEAVGMSDYIVLYVEK